MDNLRMEELRELWNAEPIDGEDWREDLTPEELDCVANWDSAYDRGMLAIASHILIREKIRKRFAPQEILDLENIRDHCRLRLRDGRLFLARLDRNNELMLNEIDEVC